MQGKKHRMWHYIVTARETNVARFCCADVDDNGAAKKEIPDDFKCRVQGAKCRG